MVGSNNHDNSDDSDIFIKGFKGKQILVKTIEIVLFFKKKKWKKDFWSLWRPRTTCKKVAVIQELGNQKEQWSFKNGYISVGFSD